MSLFYPLKKKHLVEEVNFGENQTPLQRNGMAPITKTIIFDHMNVLFVFVYDLFVRSNENKQFEIAPFLRFFSAVKMPILLSF